MGWSGGADAKPETAGFGREQLRVNAIFCLIYRM
jgi:hypothetical protein